MPFDGRNPSNAVEILSRMEESLRNGDRIWIQYPAGLGVKGGACLIEAFYSVVALGATSDELYHLNRGKRRERRQILDLLTASIRGRPYKKAFRRSLLAIARYNDAEGCTLADILGVIRKAKLLALGAGEFP
jgi:hypothetical protein